MATKPKPKPDPKPEPDDDAAATEELEAAGKEAYSGTRQSQLLSYGEKAVGINFNPSQDETVQELKELFADIINICDKARQKIMERRIASQPSEGARLWSIAITEAQTAQMWAVKAQTWKD